MTHRNEGISADTYKGRHDIVGRFRAFENTNTSSAEERVLDQLAMYDKDPLSKPELVNHMVKRISEKTDLSKVFQIKRQGKDVNDIFWNAGKIHGLENIAFCDEEDIKATNGNPFTLQKLINKNENNHESFSSYDQL